MRGNGCVSDEGRFLAGVEEPQTHIVVGGGRGGYERHFGVREFTCNRRQSGVIEPISIEDDGGRVAGEAGASECVDLKYTQAYLHGGVAVLHAS